MKELIIIVPEGQNILSSIVGSYKIFKRANAYWQSFGRSPVFRIRLAGISESIDFHEGVFSVKPHLDIREVTHADLVIIPALYPDFKKALKINERIISWIGDQYKKGAEVASLCSGAFLLASTGLMDGKNCTTHWMAGNEFRQLFPKVNLITNQIITDENGIYTNGGAYSFLNLILFLIEKYFDRETAIFCAKVFEIDIDRNCQSPFTIFSGQKDHQDELIKKAQFFLENNCQDKISLQDLADDLAIGRRNFDRRFKKATGNTPLEYLQRVKIEAAKKSLETTRKTVQEVMYDVGYSDTKAFRAIFKKVTGLSPVEYRNKYNKEAFFLKG